MASNGNFDIYDNVLILLKLIDLYDPTESNDASKPLTLVPFALRIYTIFHIVFMWINPSNVQIDLLPLKRHSYWKQICHLELFLFGVWCTNVEIVLQWYMYNDGWRYSYVISNIESVWNIGHWASWLCHLKSDRFFF